MRVADREINRDLEQRGSCAKAGGRRVIAGKAEAGDKARRSRGVGRCAGAHDKACEAVARSADAGPRGGPGTPSCVRKDGLGTWVQLHRKGAGTLEFCRSASHGRLRGHVKCK